MRRRHQFIFLFIQILLCGPAWAGPALRVQVATEADVFSLPNFKSPVADHVKQGTVVKMATKKFVGQGGIGVFYKIKTPSGKIGYMADSDLLADGKPMLAPAPPEPPPPAIKPAESEAAPKTKNGSPLLGLSLALVNYTEKFEGRNWGHSQFFFGARRLGRASTPKAWRTDFNFLFAPGAPKFLASAGAYGETTGFTLLGDLQFMKPILVFDSSMAYLGAGPLLGYSKFKTNMDSGPMSSSKYLVGAVVEGGYAILFSGGSFHADVKYYVTGTSYLGESISVLMLF